MSQAIWWFRWRISESKHCTPKRSSIDWSAGRKNCTIGCISKASAVLKKFQNQKATSLKISNSPKNFHTGTSSLEVFQTVRRAYRFRIGFPCFGTQNLDWLDLKLAVWKSQFKTLRLRPSQFEILRLRVSSWNSHTNSKLLLVIWQIQRKSSESFLGLTAIRLSQKRDLNWV